MTSPSSLQNAVAHKLSFYMTTKRREEDFDSTSRSSPVSSELAYLKSQPMPNFSQMKDRSLKHYFTSRMIRAQIAKLEAMPPGTERQRSVRRNLAKTIRRDTFEELALARSEFPVEAYEAQLEALKGLERSTSRRLYHQTGLHGNNNLSRRSFSQNMSWRESNRIVDHASQILVATETITLAQEILDRQYHAQDSRQRPKSAPILLPSARPAKDKLHGEMQKRNRARRRARYCWDINGRRVPVNSSSIFQRAFSTASHDSSSGLDESYQNGFSRRPKGVTRPMSAKEPRTTPPFNARHSLRKRPESADVVYHTYDSNMPSSSRKGFVYCDQIYAVDMATQSMEDVGLQTDMVPKPRPPDIRKYTIKIQTGDRSGAGTRADVYVVLHGDKRKTEEIFLTKNTSGTQPFQKGQVDKFDIEAVNVGRLKHIGIGHDQSEKDFSWYIDSVEVQSRDQVWCFPCEKWFSGKLSTRKTFRYLPVKTSTAASNTSMQKSRDGHRSKNENRCRSLSTSCTDTSTMSSSSRSSVKKSHAKRKSVLSRTQRRRRSSSFSSSTSQTDDGTSTDAAFAIAIDYGAAAKKYKDRRKNYDDASSDVERKKKCQLKNKRAMVKKETQHEAYNTKYSIDDVRQRPGNVLPAGKQDVESVVVEESIDSSDDKIESDSDSTLSAGSKQEAMSSEVPVAAAQPSDSVSTSSNSSSCILRLKGADEAQKEIVDEIQPENNYSQVLEVANDMNVPIEAGSSISENEDRKKRRSSIFEQFDDVNNVGNKESSPASSEAEYGAGKPALSEKLLEKTSLSLSSDDEDVFATPVSVVNQNKVVLSEQVQVKTNDPSTKLKMRADFPVLRSVKEETSSSFSEETQLEAPPLKAVKESSSSSSSEVEETEIAEEIQETEDPVDSPVIATTVTTTLIMYKKVDSSHESSSSSSDEKDFSEEMMAKKVSTASISEELPPALATAFPKKKEHLHGTPVTEDEYPQVVKVKEIPGATEVDEADNEILSSVNDESREELSSSYSEEAHHDSFPQASVPKLSNVQEQGQPDRAEITTTQRGLSAPFSRIGTQTINNSTFEAAAPSVAVVADDHGSQHHLSSSSSSVEAEDFVLNENDVYHAIEEEDVDRVKEILKQHPQVKDDPGNRDLTPLQFAASNGKLKMLRFLAFNGADLNLETMTGYTALHLAAMNGHIECLKILKSLGVGIESRNVENQTPIHLAARSGQLDAVKWLVLNGADYNVKDKNGRSVTALATQNHHKPVANFIALYRKKANERPSSSSSSALLSSSSSSSSSSESEKDEVPLSTVSQAQREEKELQEKKRIFEEQQSKMKKRRISFLDEIRIETEQDMTGNED